MAFFDFLKKTKTKQKSINNETETKQKSINNEKISALNKHLGIKSSKYLDDEDIFIDNMDYEYYVFTEQELIDYEFETFESYYFEEYKNNTLIGLMLMYDSRIHRDYHANLQELASVDEYSKAIGLSKLQMDYITKIHNAIFDKTAKELFDKLDVLKNVKDIYKFVDGYYLLER